MTKKSQARLERDIAAKAEANHKCWDELQVMSDNILNRIEISHNHLLKAVRKNPLYPFLENAAEVAVSIRSHSQDYLQLKKELNDIRGLHAARKGKHTDVDDMMLNLEIAEKYNLFNARYQSTVVPSASFIIEHFAKAEEAYLIALHASQTAADNAATDVNVVTDVVAKETTTN